jgi:hypothetical protein
MDAEIDSLKTLIKEKSKITDPSDEALVIGRKLEAYEDCSSDCEIVHVRKRLAMTIATISQEADLASMEKPFITSFFGPGSDDIAMKNLTKARQEVERAVRLLEPSVSEIVSGCSEFYTSFVLETVNNYKNLCPQLYEEIEKILGEFLPSIKERMSNEMCEWIQKSMNLIKQKKTGENLDFPLPGCKYITDKGAVAEKVRTLLVPILYHLTWIFMTIITEKLFVGFPTFLNKYLNGLEKKWQGAAQDEIDRINKDLKKLEAQRDEMEEVIRNINNL